MRNYLLLLALTVQVLAAAPSVAPLQGTPGEVIALINAYRVDNGLPALVENPILYSIAQGQADYLISQPMGTVGDVHEGPGGTRPKDRAVNAGYGGGAGVSVSEIVKGGIDENASSAMAWWKTSPPHNNTMLSSFYGEIGAGVATDNNGRWWFVANFGSQGGGAPPPPGSAATQAAQQPAAPVMIPVVKAEPRTDGSIVHIVRTGQTLWTIAAVYEVPLQQVMELNGNNETIYAGDEVIVAPPGSAPTVAPTLDPNATPIWTPSPTEDNRPTRQPTEEQLAVPQATPPASQEQTSQLSAEAKAKAANTTVMLTVGVALLSIIGVFAASFFIQRPRPPTPPENDPFAPIE